MYAKLVCHNLCVLVAEMYATGLEVIFPSENAERRGSGAPAILRFPTRL